MTEFVLYREFLPVDEFGNADLPTCCSNPKLIQVKDDGEWCSTAFYITTFCGYNYSPAKCQKCMEQLIYQQCRLHTDLSKLKEFCVRQIEGKWDVILEMDGQETHFVEVTDFVEALRLLETKFNKIKSIK